MLTDAQALRLIESMRHNTQSTDVAALCDWVLALALRRAVESAAPAATNVAPKRNRRVYMREENDRLVEMVKLAPPVDAEILVPK